MRHPVVVLAAASLFAAPAARAQNAAMDATRAAAANQLGILQYCQAQGFAGADAVAAGREAFARMPASTTPNDAAEALGRGGVVAMPDGTQAPLASVAAQSHVPVATMCRQMADSAMQASAAGKGGPSPGGIPGLPTLSGMPAVPGLAPSSAMPGVSGTPSR